MKLSLSLTVSVLISTSFPAKAATPFLGETAAGFDLFVLGGENGNITGLEMKPTNNGRPSRFNGIIGIGTNGEVKIQSGVYLGSSTKAFRHRNSGQFNNSGNASGGPIEVLGLATDGVVEEVDQQIKSYIMALNSENATASFGARSTQFDYSTNADFTVLDFASFAMDGADINLTGRAGSDDTVVIRIAGDAVFSNGSEVTLTNLNRENVIWLTSDDSVFDLHQNDAANFEGILINPTLQGSGNGKGPVRTIIGNVDFKGQVFASSLKLGSGMDFQGTNIPEPSAQLLVVLAFGSLAFRRRRK